MDVGQLFARGVEALRGSSGIAAGLALGELESEAAKAARIEREKRIISFEGNRGGPLSPEDRKGGAGGVRRPPSVKDADIVGMLAMAVVYGTGSFPQRTLDTDNGDEFPVLHTDLSTVAASPSAGVVLADSSILAYTATMPETDQRTRSLTISWETAMNIPPTPPVERHVAGDGDGSRIPSPPAVQSAVTLMRQVAREYEAVREEEETSGEAKKLRDGMDPSTWSSIFRVPILGEADHILVSQRDVKPWDRCSPEALMASVDFSQLSRVAEIKRSSIIAPSLAPPPTIIALEDDPDLQILLGYNHLEKITALTGSVLPAVVHRASTSESQRFEDRGDAYDYIASYRNAYIALLLSAYAEYNLHAMAHSPVENGGTEDIITRTLGAHPSIGWAYLHQLIAPTYRSAGFQADVASSTPAFYGEYVFYAALYFLMSFWRIRIAQVGSSAGEDIYGLEMVKLQAILDALEQPIRAGVYRRACYLFWVTIVGGDARLKYRGRAVSELVEASFPLAIGRGSNRGDITPGTFAFYRSQGRGGGSGADEPLYLASVVNGIVYVQREYMDRELDRREGILTTPDSPIYGLMVWAAYEQDNGVPWVRMMMFAADAASHPDDQFTSSGATSDLLPFPQGSLFAAPLDKSSLSDRIERLVWEGLGCGGRDDGEAEIMSMETVSFDANALSTSEKRRASPAAFVEDLCRAIIGELLIHAVGHAAPLVKTAILTAGSNRLFFQNAPGPTSQADGAIDEEEDEEEEEEEEEDIMFSDDDDEEEDEGVDGNTLGILSARTSAYSARSLGMAAALDAISETEQFLVTESSRQLRDRTAQDKPSSGRAKTTVWHLPIGEEMHLSASFTLLGPSIGLSECEWTISYARNPFRVAGTADRQPINVTECGVYCTHAGGSAVEHGLVITAIPDPVVGAGSSDNITERESELQIEARCTRFQVIGGVCTATTEHMCLQATVPETASLVYSLAKPGVRRVHH